MPDAIQCELFVSYSHQDNELFLNELLANLKPYVRNGRLIHWSDKEIGPGSQWSSDIESALNTAKAAILLVSPNFLASDFIHHNELGPLLKKAKTGGVQILWVPIYASAYVETDLNKIQSCHMTNRPIGKMNPADRAEAWVEICELIDRKLNPSKDPPTNSGATSVNPPFSVPPITRSKVFRSNKKGSQLRPSRMPKHTWLDEAGNGRGDTRTGSIVAKSWATVPPGITGLALLVLLSGFAWAIGYGRIFQQSPESGMRALIAIFLFEFVAFLAGVRSVYLANRGRRTGRRFAAVLGFTVAVLSWPLGFVAYCYTLIAKDGKLFPW